MLLAGEMAALRNISKQTLIHYDRIGLFRPSRIDPKTGYRYYDLNQCEEIEVILCLKDMGFSLKEVKDYLKRPSGERIHILEERGKKMDRELERIRTTRRHLNTILASMKTAMEIQPFKPEIYEADPIPVTFVTIPEPNDLLAMEKTLKQTIVDSNLALEASIPNYIFFLEPGKRQDPYFTRISFPGGPDLVPGGTHGRIFHTGGFDSIDQTREILVRFIRKAGFDITGQSMMLMHLGALGAAHQDDYRIEIRFALKEKK